MKLRASIEMKRFDKPVLILDELFSEIKRGVLKGSETEEVSSEPRRAC